MQNTKLNTPDDIKHYLINLKKKFNKPILISTTMYVKFLEAGVNSDFLNKYVTTFSQRMITPKEIEDTKFVLTLYKTKNHKPLRVNVNVADVLLAVGMDRELFTV